MNIKHAKRQIKNTVAAYLKKDQYGEYRIPFEKQRPVFLLGVPGIGKTAVIGQVSRELGIGYVSYSMTHHTRQSALGLPYITRKTYGNREYSVSEYTMSEIIASVYETVEATGVSEGILFLDEVNCVSETLAPAMLQFLQYKVFGQHSLPRGWVIVTAGNPREYNRSVRDFDIAMLDRLKVIEVEPDYAAFREYAYTAQVHGAILSYLNIKKDCFYVAEMTAEGKKIVTPRAWEDLSDLMKLYEEMDLPVDEEVTGQYLQNKQTARDFALYYILYQKYRDEYGIETILQGKWDGALAAKASKARFDERISLTGLLQDAVFAAVKACMAEEDVLLALTELLRGWKQTPGVPFARLCASQEAQSKTQFGSGLLTEEKKAALRGVDARLRQYERDLPEQRRCAPEKSEFDAVRALFRRDTKAFERQTKQTGNQLEQMFSFAEQAFAEGHELQVMVSSMTGNYDCARFVEKYGCAPYFRHNQSMMFHEREQELAAGLAALDADRKR